MQETSIRILRMYSYHASVTCGLLIESDRRMFPLVVGCSLKTLDGDIIDLPAQTLPSAGKALWSIQAPNACLTRDEVPKEWEGFIIFAVYTDKTFSRRLADTGWKTWTAMWLVGTSTRGVQENDDEIRAEYAGRIDIWQPL